MPERRWLLFLPWSVLAILPVLLLWPDLRPPQGRWFNAGWNLLHVPAFFFLTLALRSILKLPCSPRAATWLAVAGSVVLAGVSEAAQSLGGRSASLGDVLFDTVGIGLATLWIIRSRAPLLRFWFPALLVVVACLAPAWGYVIAERVHRGRLPEIGAFSTVSGRMLWKAQGNTKVSAGGGDGPLRVEIGRGKYGGVSFLPGVHDWSGYSELVVSITNPQGPFRLGILIDGKGDRETESRRWLNRSFEVRPGESELVVDLAYSPRQGPGRGTSGLNRSNEGSDLSQMIRLALFTGEEEKNRVFDINSAFLRR